MANPGRVALAALALTSIQAAELTYWVEPCTRPETACLKSDPELADWALKAWQSAAAGGMRLQKVDRAERAQIRVYWADGLRGQYGETTPILVGGKRGAEVHVRPDMRQLGPDIAAATREDPLLRDAIVYLTCLHETGHALGLPHTSEFADIMYTFQLGGDIREYFGRYRRKLTSREDIQKNAGMSAEDRARLRAALERQD